MSYHRRPLISADDIAAIITARLGSGCNGLGYYMYHGGKNPIGAHTTMMQECRVTGYKNDYARISYDFQAPLGDCGQIRQSYYTLGSIHAFLSVSNEKLAPMPAFFPIDPPADPFDKDYLRCAVRSDGKSGFLFINNYSRRKTMKHLQTTVEIDLPHQNALSIPLDVLPNAYGIIPFRYQIGSEIVEWMTAMPIEQDEKHLVVQEIEGIKPQICLQNGQIIHLCGDITLGGITVSKVKLTKLSTEDGERLPLSVKEEKLPDTVFEHIQNIGWQPLRQLETTDYGFILPKNATYLRIRALGNAAAVFANGKLISDFYLYGDEWIVDVRELCGGEELIIKILPFDEENRSLVYLETDMPLGAQTPEVFALFCETPIIAPKVN